MDLAGIRKIIQKEEAKYAAAVSEAFASRLGQAVNFINFFQTTEREWILNGRYGASTGAQVGVDGAITFINDIEIVGFSMFNFVAGSSGVTEIDIKRHTGAGAGSTIFTTRPSISYAAGNTAYLSLKYNPDLTLQNPAGTILPVFASRNVNAGDALTLDFISRQLGGESLTVSMAVRPR